MDSVYLEWSDEPIPDNLASPVEIMDWYKDHKQGDLLYSGKEIYFAKRVIHRATNYGTHPATFVEVAYGVNDEDDIVRLEDRYGRA
jgi:mannose-6-phosphate isomerase-like protein (cupin superfamily)